MATRADNNQENISDLTIHRKWIKRGVWALTTIFIFMNVLAVFHSYKFTHFADDKIEKTKDPKKLSTGQKIETLILGLVIRDQKTQLFQ